MSLEKQYNYFYKIINLIDGNFYYGIHSTNNLDDGYLGSGKYLKAAIKKHGKENFIKEIIADYPTRKEASDHEKRVVTQELIELEECYNLKTGGDNECVFKYSDASRRKMSESLKKYFLENGAPVCKQETKDKVSKANKGRLAGENHPQFGKVGEESLNFGRKYPIEFGQEISRRNTGKKHSATAKEKMRIKATGRKHTLETIEKIRLNSKNQKNKHSIKCNIDGMIFNSIRQVGIYFDISSNIVRQRLKNDVHWPTWIIIGEDQS